MASLLLRDLVQDVDAAVADKTPNRKASLVAVVGKVGSVWGTIEAASSKQPIDAHGLGVELANVAGACHRLGDALAAEHLSETQKELRSQVDHIAGVVADKTLATMLRTGTVPASVPAARGLTDSEHVELFRQAIAGATSAIARFRATPIKDDRALAIALCEPIPHHLHLANDEALTVLDRAQRRKLTPEVEGVSQQLEEVAQTLSMTPKVKWDVAFARTFDAENQLRKTLGLAPRARPYSGTIDPQQALEAIKASADGKSHDATDYTKLDAVDPQSAINTVAIGVDYVFVEQQRALRNLQSDLKEPPPPKQPSIFDAMLEVAINVALGGVIGAIGGIVADRLRRSLDKFVTGRADILSKELARVAEGVTYKERNELRTAMMTRMVADSTLHRVAAVDGAKDALKVLFRDSIKVARDTNKPKGVNARQPLSAFKQQQEQVLVDAQHQATLMLALYAPALAQLDLATLNELSHHINGELAKAAYDLQYDASLRAWQNFRAQLEAPMVRGYGPDAAPTRDVDLSGHAIDGVLEVRCVLGARSPKHDVQSVSMTLRGGEPAALRHLRAHPRTLDDTGLNTRYVMVFDVEPHGSFELGVGPDLGLQRPSSIDLKVLKLVASKQPIMTETILAAYMGAYDDVSDGAATTTAKQLLQLIAKRDTSGLSG